MNEEIPTNQTPVPENAQPVPPMPEVATTQEVKKPTFLESLKASFAKFKANKKLFIPTVIILSILILVIIMGSIYSLMNGSKNTNEVIPSPTSSPVSNLNQEPTLSENQEKLKSLKDQIINLDLEQKRLQPPTLNFKISF